MTSDIKKLKEGMEGDLSIFMQKYKFHKVSNENSQESKNTTLKNISQDCVQAKKPRRFNSTQFLPRKFEQTDTTDLENKKEPRRKNSQVSIVQDFLNYHQKQPSRTTQISQQKYTINNELIFHFQQQNPQKCNLSKDEKCTLQTAGSVVSHEPSKNEKYKHIKAFFQYVLEFKLMNMESYNPKIMKEVEKYANQPLLSPRARKSAKSLSVHFEPDGVQVNLKEVVKQVNQPEDEARNKLQQSQASIVNVQVSDGSLQNEMQIQTIQNQFNQLDSKSIKSMKKDKHICIDFQNPNETSLDEIDPLDLTEQHQNMGQTPYKSQSRIVSLQGLKQRVQNAEQDPNKYVHHGYFCDECKIDPIVGRRYRCVQCEEYDLCQKCYQRQCKKFKTIMNAYQNDKQTSSKIDFGHITAQISPLMKKKMSDIKEETQLISSEEGIVVSSDNCSYQDTHVHIMQEVNKSRPQFQQNLQKVLKESNRFSNQILDKKSQRVSSKSSSRNLSPLTPQLLRNKDFNKTRLPFSKIFMSERTIPLKNQENHDVQILESNKAKIEKLKRQSMKIKNLMK